MKVKLNRHHTYSINVAYGSDCPDWKWSIQHVLDRTWNRLLKHLPGVKNKVHLDPADSWSCDYTLSKIAYPLLIQLKKTNHGYGFIDDEDVPEELRSGVDDRVAYGTYDEASEKITQAKFDWFMDEIIWTMKQLAEDENESPNTPEGMVSMFDDDYNTKKDFPEQKKLTKKWMAEVQEYENKIQNGCRLFGKYFRSLWD